MHIDVKSGELPCPGLPAVWCDGAANPPVVTSGHSDVSISQCRDHGGHQAATSRPPTTYQIIKLTVTNQISKGAHFICTLNNAQVDEENICAEHTSGKTETPRVEMNNTPAIYRNFHLKASLE